MSSSILITLNTPKPNQTVNKSLLTYKGVTSLELDLTGIVNQRPALSVIIDWGDGSVRETYTSNVFSGDSILTSYNHTYNPVSTHLNKLSIQVLISFNNGSYTKIVQPLTLVQESYYDNIKEILINSSAIHDDSLFSIMNLQSKYNKQTWPAVWVDSNLKGSSIIPCTEVDIITTEPDPVVPIEFVTVGDAGNAADTTTYGSVSYEYRISKYTIRRSYIDAYNAANGGPTITMYDMNVFGGNGNDDDAPAAAISWNESARFINWLNAAEGEQEAYRFETDGYNDNITLWDSVDAWQDGGENRFRHKDCKYFLPSEDEWYKAAYYDGDLDVYYQNAQGRETYPDRLLHTGGTDPYTAVYTVGTSQPDGPALVYNCGGLSPYGVMGMGGNIYHLMEGTFTGSLNTGDIRTRRGGSWGNTQTQINKDDRFFSVPTLETFAFGFRVGARAEVITTETICYNVDGGPVFDPLGFNS